MEFKGDILLVLYGLITCVLLIIDGILCLKGICENLQIRDYVASILIMLSALLLMLSEVNHYLKRYPFVRYTNKIVLFLKHRTGRGIYYIVMGALCLTKVKYMIAIGAFSAVCGLTNLILAAVLNRIAQEGNKDMEVVELPNKAAFQELEAIEEQEKSKQLQHT